MIYRGGYAMENLVEQKLSIYIDAIKKSLETEICGAVTEWISKNKYNEEIQKSVIKIIEINDNPINHNGIYIE